MFAIPGIRLGYIMANCEIIAKLTSYQPHWSVNSVALAIGNLCLEEDSYIENTVQFITSEREKLFSFYEKYGFEVSLSKVNFYLVRDPGKTISIHCLPFYLKRELFRGIPLIFQD